jgi:membrane-associated PAP2 superfamily phosphatase
MHPSFPSGHALQSWLIARCLTKVIYDYKPHLKWLARRIAINRERAGLHYRSDTDAGYSIAKQLKDNFLFHDKWATDWNNTTFKEIVRNARDEWL